jgi:TolB-like protein/DNA-binding SARP family transcriptional activator
METGSALGNPTCGTARWSLRLFGGFEMSQVPGGERVTTLGKRERVLLAYLALSPKGRQQRRKLASLLWGDATDSTLLDNLRTCIWAVRKSLGDGEHRLIASEGEDIALDAAAFDVDAVAFRRLAAQTGHAELEAAAALSTGPFLGGLDIDSEDYESWRREEATKFRDQTIDVLNRLMTQLADSGESERAIAAATRLLRLEPLHEAAVRRLMRLYADSDRRGAAIEVYRTLSETLHTELNTQPKAETRAVFAELSGGGEEQPAAPADATPLPPSVTEPSAAAPSPPVSWPAQAGHPGDEALAQRKQTHALDRRPAEGRDKWVALVNSKWQLAGGLAVAMIAALLLYQFAPSSGTPPVQQPAISIAVLPLVNLSGDASQEFFSDGMTEEITTTLAKISGLRVVGRTSASNAKQQMQDLRAIGQALGATHLIEGSVRKDGDRLRITAQLIMADDGTHIWAENYDRQLTDVFAIQEDIARAIASALRTPLGLPAGQTLVALRPKDEQTYELFLRGRAAVRARRSDDAIGFLEQVVARDPNFAPGWRFLAQARNNSNVASRIRGEALRAYPESEETLARRVIALAPDSADGYAMLASLAQAEGQTLEAIRLREQALERDPNDTEVMNSYANDLWGLGYLKKALEVRERQHRLEPLVPIYNFLRAETLAANGMLDQAVREWVAARPNPAAGGIRLIAPAYAQLGRYDDAIEVIRAGTEAAAAGTGGAPPLPQAQVDAAVQVLRATADKAPPPAQLPDFRDELLFVYAYTSTPERMLDAFQQTSVSPLTALRYTWWPVPSSVRKTERFKTLMRDAGFVAIWRVRGWPDRCRPVGADDFECE